MYRLAAQEVHRNGETKARGSRVFQVADFTEVFLKPMAYSVFGRAGQFLFLVMSLLGSQNSSVPDLLDRWLTATLFA